MDAIRQAMTSRNRTAPARVTSCGGDGPLEPRPRDDIDVADIFDFSDIRRPPRPESGQTVSGDDLLNVSIMLPLRSREPEGDQFSNYGNGGNLVAR